MRERPIAALIFGILSIGYGLLKCGGSVLAVAMSNVKLPGAAALQALKSDPTYAALLTFGTWTGLALGLALLAFGIGLLLMKNWARLGLIVYAMIEIIIVPLVAVISWPFTRRMMEQMPGQAKSIAAGFAMMVMAVQVIVGLAYPVLLLIFMTRSNVIDACQPEQPPAPPAP